MKLLTELAGQSDIGRKTSPRAHISHDVGAGDPVKKEFPATLSKDSVMTQNIRKAMLATFGLALIATIGVPALAQDEMMPGEQSVAADYGEGCCEVCCTSGGSTYGEFQYVRLNSYDTDGSFEDFVSNDDGYRLVLGYENCDGLGLRVRYFDFDSVQQDGGNDYGLDLYYIDLEVTQSFCLGCLNGVVSAGYRHGEHELWYDDDLYSNIEGDGVTMGLELQRDITCNLSLYGWTQYSIMVGDDDAQFDNYIFNWTEVQLGAHYSTCVGGYNAFARGGVEAQFHDGVAGGFESGLFGWFLSAGVTY